MQGLGTISSHDVCIIDAYVQAVFESYLLDAR